MKHEINAKQTAKLNMYQVTGKHLDDNSSIFAANPAFQTAFNKFKANITAITGSAQQKSAVLTGIATDKTNSKQALVQIAVTVAGVVFAYASASGNNTLKEEMNLPVTTLTRTRDENLIPLCRHIHETAAAHLVALGNYGITAQLLADFQTAIDNYASATQNPRSAITHRKTVNANINDLFKENDQLLVEQVDKLIELYRPAHPDFVKTYESARIIVDPPTKARKLNQPGNEQDHNNSK